MRKTLITILSLIVAASTMQAKPRTQTQLMEAAAKVLNRAHVGMHRVMSNQTMQILSQDEQLTFVGYEGGGYAIVTNDDILPAIVGYSPSRWEADSDNENFNWWCRMMRLSVKAIVERGMPHNVMRPDQNGYPTEVPQMMTTAWGQMEPYNNACPMAYDKAGNERGRTVVGCVATAITQIMNYNQYPRQGEGRHTDTQTTDAWGNVRPITVDFADYTYDYSRLRDTYTPGSYTQEEADEVARLSYSTGVSFGMIYDTDASGTFLDSAAVAVKKYLGYRNAKYYSRGTDDESAWMKRIYEELSNGRPLAYGGADDLFTVGGGGHCFVFDGYDANGLVHVNWGWYGKYDGYYDVNLLNPRIHNFKNSQDMIVGLGIPDVTEPMKLALEGDLDEFMLTQLVENSMSNGLRTADLSRAQLKDGILPPKAFNGSKLTTIILPANTTQIGDGAFAACRDLKEVVFPEATVEQQFMVEDDVIYTKDGREVIEVMPYYSNKRQVMDAFTSLLTFREGVTTIHDHAMDGCFRIKGVVLPASVSQIGKHIFAHASSIKHVKTLATTPAKAVAEAFSALDAGYTQLSIPAGTWDVYSRHGEWQHFFTLDNVMEFGTNIKARNIVRRVGEKNPELRYQMFGEYVTGEPILSCEADENSPAGDYPIIVEMGTITDADVTLTNGVMRVVDDATAIRDITTEDSKTIYTLDGRKTTKHHKGIVVTKNSKLRIEN